ncbi:MAG: S-adenosylmethionine:tRNA ribosyltransferase-isomerase, partial [Thermoplasmata archaeon]
MTTDPPNLARAAPFSIDDLDYDLPSQLIAQHPLPERDAAKLLVLERDTGHLHDLTVRDLADLLRPGDLLVLNNTKVLPAKFHARRRTGGLVPGLFVAEESAGLWRVMLEGSKRLKVEETLILEENPPLSPGPKDDPPVSPRTMRGNRGVPEPRGGVARASCSCSHRLEAGATTDQDQHRIELRLERRLQDGEWLVRLAGRCADRPAAECTAVEVLETVGETPLPPYIHRGADVPPRNRDDRDVADRDA